MFLKGKVRYAVTRGVGGGLGVGVKKRGGGGWGGGGGELVLFNASGKGVNYSNRQPLKIELTRRRVRRPRGKKKIFHFTV